MNSELETSSEQDEVKTSDATETASQADDSLESLLSSASPQPSIAEIARQQVRVQELLNKDC